VLGLDIVLIIALTRLEDSIGSYTMRMMNLIIT